MDINKFEVKYNLAPGELTKVLKKKYPSFSKVALSFARHSAESGVQLTPSAVKYLKSIYEEPKQAKPQTHKQMKISKDVYDLLEIEAKSQNIPIETLIKQWLSKEM